MAPLRRPGGPGHRGELPTCQPRTAACLNPPMPASRPSSATRPLTRRLALSGLAALAGGAVATAVAGPAFAQTASTTTTGSATSGSGAGRRQRRPEHRAGAHDDRPAQAADLGGHRAARLRPEPRVRRVAALRPGHPDAERRTGSRSAAVFGRHHQAYGEQIGALLGRRAPGVANQTLLDERTPAFGARTEPAILRAAYELEISLAASYTQLLGLLKGTDGITLVASFQPVEARQAVVLGQATDVAGRGPHAGGRGRRARRHALHPVAVPDHLMATVSDPQPVPGAPMPSDSPARPPARPPPLPGARRGDRVADRGRRRLRQGGRGHPGERRGRPAGDADPAAGHRRGLPAHVVVGRLQRHRVLRHAARDERPVVGGRRPGHLHRRPAPGAGRPARRRHRRGGRPGLREAQPVGRRSAS